MQAWMQDLLLEGVWGGAEGAHLYLMSLRSPPSGPLQHGGGGQEEEGQAPYQFLRIRH